MAKRSTHRIERKNAQRKCLAEDIDRQKQMDIVETAVKGGSPNEKGKK